MRRTLIAAALAIMTLAAALLATNGTLAHTKGLFSWLGIFKRQTEKPPLPKPAPKAAPQAKIRQLEPLIRTRTAGGAVVFIPTDCLRAEPRYDLLFHFHGASDVVADGVKQAKLYAVIAVLNAGTGGDTYARAFAGRNMLTTLLADVRRAIQTQCGAVPSLGRIALSGFSAGYGGVASILKNEASRVDAVLLADGIHASFDDVRRRHIENNQLACFVDFGQKAMRGEKLFAITHSAIQTPNYASTTESTDFLLKKLGVERTLDVSAHTSRAAARGFQLESESGMDAPAHMRHLYKMGRTLLPKLSDRWQ